ncbi:GntR family transcriptional regulator [Sinomonas halotolerans]|uniref:GntR family transcriptional regulator n=1 Tax=Sinomonas halotolerans TaxID=1644133 RepID=A0ABU9X454_9MICC
MAEQEFPGKWRPDTELVIPLFEQLRRRILALVDDGALPVGRRLPPVRGLATELGVAPHTVARAYRELEEAGVLVTAGRAGTSVAPRGAREEELAAAARSFAAAVLASGASLEDALALAASAYREGQGRP